MKEGQLLKAWLDYKRFNKQELANSMGITKQTLFQLFASKKLKQETIDKIEVAASVKWGRIVKDYDEGKFEVNTDIDENTGPQDREELIESLKGQIKLLQKEVANSDALKETIANLLSSDDTPDRKVQTVLMVLGKSAAHYVREYPKKGELLRGDNS